MGKADAFARLVLHPGAAEYFKDALVVLFGYTAAIVLDLHDDAAGTILGGILTYERVIPFEFTPIEEVAP